MPQAELMRSEVFGLSRGRETILEGKYIDKLLSSSMTLPTDSIDELFTWIDPSGGGMCSAYALVSMSQLQSGKYVIHGLSKDPNRHFLDEEAVTMNHFRAARTNACTRKATFVQFCENNYGGAPTVTRILSYADLFKPVENMCESLVKPGVCTTQITKEEAVLKAQEEFAHCTIVFADNWFSTAKKPEEKEEIKKELGAQLRRFRKQIKHKARGNFTYEYTGKEGLSGADDLAFGVFSCIYWMERYKVKKEHEKFLQLRASRGYRASVT
jgi:hypothetical protein